MNIHQFDYSYKLKKSQIIAALLIDHPSSYYQDLPKQMFDFCEQYDITMVMYEDVKGKSLRNYTISHLIVISNVQDADIATQKYRHCLNQFNCMSLSLCYDNEQAMLSQQDKIEQLKQHLGKHINYLRPNITLEDGQRFISIQKLIDNAICDTIRVKYTPNAIDTQAVDLTPKEIEYFSQVSMMFKNFTLYHRSLSDGFIALRRGEGFLITCTKTYKYPLDLTRISFVQDYDRENNILSYRGKYLPSSDVVEASVVFKNNPDITAIIHTHASEHFTRNPEYRHKIGVGKNSYGIPELGDLINGVIDQYRDDFLILEEHGEFFNFVGNIDEVCHKMSNICQKEIHDHAVTEN